MKKKYLKKENRNSNLFFFRQNLPLKEKKKLIKHIVMKKYGVSEIGVE